jgi:gp16 family phage-associated protein
MSLNGLKTKDQVKAEFIRTGTSIAGWARQHNVNRALVGAILNEERPCRIGQSHKIAVLLGIKNGEVVND